MFKLKLMYKYVPNCSAIFNFLWKITHRLHETYQLERSRHVSGW